MAKYVKKPVVIEAFQFNGNIHVTASSKDVPDWFKGALSSGDVKFSHECGCLFIETLEGTHRANIGDYVIKGVKGELYPCKPDIFCMTYQAVEDGE